MDIQKLNRRGFLKGSALSLGAMAMGNVLLAKTNSKQEEYVRNFSLTFTHKSRFETNNALNLWLPLALSNAFQTPYNLNIEGNYDSYSLHNENNTPLLHAQWQQNDDEKYLKTSLNIKVRFLDTHLDIANTQTQEIQDRYLRTNPTISSIVQSAITGNESDMQKIEKLFMWVAHNISSAEGSDIKGIRTIRDIQGNEILRGENLSASSVFVALCREAHIPSIECFGISLDSGRYNLNNNQPTTYTRSAVYVNNKWLVNDTLLAIKAREHSQGINMQSSATNTKHDASYYGNIMKSSLTQWDNNWAMLNYSREITLDSILVSTLQEAYGEVDGAKLSSYNVEHYNSAILV